MPAASVMPAPWSPMPPRWNGGESRAPRAQRHGLEAQALERVEPNVGQEGIRAVEQREREVAARRHREVDHDAALRAVVHLEGWIERYVAAEHLRERARGVTAPRLDLDDVGAPIAEQAAGRRPRDPDAELDDADALERAAHRRRAAVDMPTRSPSTRCAFAPSTARLTSSSRSSRSRTAATEPGNSASQWG